MPFQARHPRRLGALSGAIAALAAVSLAAVLLADCSSGNNHPKVTPTRAATAPAATSTGAAPAGTSTPATAAAPSGTPLAAACPVPSGTRPPATLQPIGTPNPMLAAAAQKLAPTLLQNADLPPALRDFQGKAPVAVSNQDYVGTQANGECLARLLDQIGRLGGAQVSWSKVGTYQRGQHTPLALIDICSQFATADGARQGLAFVFSQTNNPPKTNPTDQISVASLDAGSYGDESRAVRVDDRQNVLADNPNGTPSPVNLRQTFFNVSWRRGTVVCSLQSVAIDEDPSLADLKALAQLQDQRLKDAGF